MEFVAFLISDEALEHFLDLIQGDGGFHSVFLAYVGVDDFLVERLGCPLVHLAPQPLHRLLELIDVQPIPLRPRHMPLEVLIDPRALPFKRVLDLGELHLKLLCHLRHRL